MTFPLFKGSKTKDTIDKLSGVSFSASPLVGFQILVVDDDADMREFLTFVLEEYGATVTTVASAFEALTALSQFHPNVIISDIGMPQMDGYMLMQQVRSLKPEQGGEIPALSEAMPKAIALTAYAAEIDYQRAMAAGFQLHIPKPVEPEELVRAIQSLNCELNQWNYS